MRLFLLVIVSLIFNLHIFSQPCYLDPSFNRTGYSEPSIHEEVSSTSFSYVLTQPDGKVIGIGLGNPYSCFPTTYHETLAVRYNTDGTMDKTYGNDGIFFGSLMWRYDRLLAAGLQGDNNVIIAVNEFDDDFKHEIIILARLDQAGNRDKAFRSPFPWDGEYAYSFGTMTIQSDGKILIGGKRSFKTYSDPEDKPFVARLNADGSFDESFGTGGIAIVEDYGSLVISSLFAQSDRKIIIGEGAASIRLNEDGSPDVTFNNAQIITGKMKQLTNGKYVIAGSGLGSDGVSTDLAVAQYNSDWTLDGSFGTGGISIIHFPGNSAAELIQERQEGLLIKGKVEGTSSYSVFVKLTNGGLLDQTYGNNGIIACKSQIGAASVFSGDRLYTGGSTIVKRFGENVPFAVIAAIKVDCISTTYYRDVDGDGYGDPTTGMMSCTPLGVGYVTSNSDCNDGNATIHPGAIEICNNIDDNCDGQIDEGCPQRPYLSLSDATVCDLDGLVNIKVVLSKKTSQPVTVNFATLDGTATSKATIDNPADYEETKGTLVIPAGEMVGTITIPLVPEDYIQDPGEYFKVRLHKVTNAIASDRVAIVTINECPLEFSPCGYYYRNVRNKASIVEQTVSNGDMTVSVFPNPSNSAFILQTKTEDLRLTTIRVVDMLGRTVEVRQNLPANGTIRIGEGYKAGIYLVEVLQGQQRKVLKLVKQ